MGRETASDSPRIRCRQDGPYVVTGLQTLSDSRGDPIPTRSKAGKSNLALCRCGRSAKKPYCDGTHAKIGFTSGTSEDRVPDRRDTYVGKGITIHDNRAICAHAGFCTDALSKVWRMGEEPWIDPDGAEAEAIVETIRKCPSGALSYSAAAKGPGKETRAPAIQVVPGGPYYVTGNVELEDAAWGEGAAQEIYALCRCGGSKNKPFCDGSHWNIPFDVEPEANGDGEAEPAHSKRI